MSSPVKARADADLNLLREARQEVEEFNLEYCRVLDEGRIEKTTELLVLSFTGNDAYLFQKLEAWMMEAKDQVREEIKSKVGL